MARLSNAELRSPAYVARLVNEGRDNITSAQNRILDILADADSSADPAEFQQLIATVEQMRDTADSMARLLKALAARIEIEAGLKAQLAAKGDTKGDSKPAGKSAKMAAAAE
jgi:hypothetical protein